MQYLRREYPEITVNSDKNGVVEYLNEAKAKCYMNSKLFHEMYSPITPAVRITLNFINN